MVATGIVLRRLQSGAWSPPASLAAVGGGLGIQLGARNTDSVIVRPPRYRQRLRSLASLLALSRLCAGTLGVACGQLTRPAPHGLRSTLGPVHPPGGALLSYTL